MLLDATDPASTPIIKDYSILTDSTITENTVEALALAVGINLTPDELASLTASAQATASDMASLDVLDLRNVEPSIIFQASPSGESQ
jgi:hypothetical protein